MTEGQNNARNNLSAMELVLIEEVEALAQCFSNKTTQIPESAWKFWFDAVKGSTPKDVKQVIYDWSKTSSRMITPSDLYKALQAKRSQKRENEAQQEAQKDHKPLPRNVAQVFTDKLNESLKKNIPADAWARRDRILEAYGFVLTEHVKKSWRRALNLPDDYCFGDTDGVFPLDKFPDERLSAYHDCRIHFKREYEERYDLNLVYDKELATKRYPSLPLRWTGAAQSEGVNSAF